MSDKDLNREQERQVPSLGVDPGLAWRKQLLGRLIVGQTIAVSVLALAVTTGGLLAPESGLLALVPLGVIAAVVGLVAYWLLRRGQLEPASYVFLLGTSVAITSNVFVRGYQDVSGIYYLWPIMGSVFLLGTQGGIAVTVVSALLYLGLVVLQSLGIQTPLLPVDPQADVALTVISRLLMFFLLAFIGWLASQNLDRALQQSRQTAQRWQDLSETLEQRVVERTRDLEQLTLQLTTAADVGRAATSILELETLARQVVELIRERFDLYYAGLFLVDSAGQYAVLEAGTGEPGSLMKEQGHKLRVGGVSMVGSACAQRRARIALDVGEEAVRFDNPLLPNTRSEMALPLLVGDRVLGALDVQSTEQAAFSREDIAVLQLMADQVAVAVDNARKFSEEATVVEATSPLFRVSRRLTAATSSGEVAQAIIDSVSETEADVCAVAQYGISGKGEVTTITFLASWDRRGPAQFPVGVSLPASEPMFPLPLMMQPLAIEDMRLDPRVPERTRHILARSGALALANIPLRMGDRLLGFVNIGRATTGPWSPVAMRLYETLADQAAVALERAVLLEAAQRRASREQRTREITDRMSQATDMGTLMKVTVQEIAAALGAPGAFVQLAVPLEGTAPTSGRPSNGEDERD